VRNTHYEASGNFVHLQLTSAVHEVEKHAQVLDHQVELMNVNLVDRMHRHLQSLT